VAHNQFVHSPTLDDIVAYFDQPRASASDPALGAIWRDVLPRLDGVRVALILRPVADVLASLRALGCDAPFLPRLLERYAAVLDDLARSGLAKVFHFSELRTRDGAAALFEHCTGEPLDLFWGQVMLDRNLQSPEVAMPQTVADGPIARAMLALAQEP
jgi:hypothetical protein